MANTSSLKIPMKRPLPLPLLSVDMSPWYQEMPKGSLGCWMTNRVYSVFLAACVSVTSMIWLPSGVERICTVADTFLRQSLATADLERTISKWGGWALLAMATPASSTPTSSATPKMSHSRARFLVLTSSRSFPRPMLLGRFALFLGAVSIDTAPRENVAGGHLSTSHCVYPPPSLWDCPTQTDSASL